MRLRSAIVAVVALAGAVLSSAAQKPFYLHDGDTVVMYGDSITEQRFYTLWVEIYTATRFPKLNVTFFPEGVGGDRVTGGAAGPIDTRIPRDIVAHKPTVVTIMLGMNDCSYQPLTPAIESTYVAGYEHILTTLEQSLPGVRITLLGASPYDEVTRPEMFPGGYNGTLQHFAELNAEMARRHHQSFVDLNAPFVAALKRGAAIDPLATELLLPDRVHPEQTAHWLMAQAILMGWNSPALVSSTAIDAEKAAVTTSENTHISALATTPDGISWTQLDGSLPLPIDFNSTNNHFLTQMTDLVEQLDLQPLTVTGLKPGAYELTIDQTSVGKFTDLELDKGINLALYNTPMRGQAFRVGWNLRDRENTEYVRMHMLVDEMKTGVSHRQAADDLAAFEQTEQTEIHEMAQPKAHSFRLSAVPTQK